MAAGQLECDADTGHFRDRLRLILAVRVDEGDGLREIGFALVVVGDDKVDAELPAERGLGVRRDAAVDRDDQLHALLFECVDGDGVQPVALFQTGWECSSSRGRRGFEETRSEDRWP